MSSLLRLNKITWRSTRSMSSRIHIDNALTPSNSLMPSDKKQNYQRFLYTTPASQDQKKVDKPIYEVKFKPEMDVKKTFKEFYSLYGPLFLVCHIGIALINLGFFSAIVYLAIDITPYIPNFVINSMGEQMASVTASGGKFVLAYALHKTTLPLRLLASLGLTKYLAPRLKWAKRN